MFGRMTIVPMAIALLALTSVSNAGVLHAPPPVEVAPTATYSNIDLNSTQAGAAASPKQNHDTDVPSAPLPPAVWPGLAVLLTLGGVRVVLRARRRGIWV
jgi:hypothetical protein